MELLIAWWSVETHTSLSVWGEFSCHVRTSWCNGHVLNEGEEKTMPLLNAALRV